MKDKIKSKLKNKFIKNISFIFTGTALSSIVELINTMLLIKIVGLEKNGIFLLGLSYTNFFNTLFNFQSYDAIIKFLPNNMSYQNKKGQNYIKQAIILDIITAIFAYIIGFLFLNKIANYFNWNNEIEKCTKIMLITILFTLTGAFSGVLRIFEKFYYISIINTIKPLLNLILYIIGIFIAKDNLFYYAYSNIISTLILTIITIIFTYRVLKEYGMEKLNIFKVKLEKEFLKFNLYTNLSSTLDIPIFQITPFIINKYLGLSDISVYKILEMIGGIISKATGVVSQVITPEISKKIATNQKKEAYILGYKLGKYVIALGMIVVFIISLSYKYWLGYIISDYNKYIYCLYLYLIFIIFTQSFTSLHQIFTYLNYVRANIVILMGANSIYLVLVIYLTKKIGLEGLIISRIMQAFIVFSSKLLILQFNNKNNNQIKGNIAN